MADKFSASTASFIIEATFGAFVGGINAHSGKGAGHTALVTTGANAVEQLINPLFGVKRSAKQFAFGSLVSTTAGVITNTLMRSHIENQKLAEHCNCKDKGAER